eukprot:gene14524-19500_t
MDHGIHGLTTTVSIS